MTFSYSYAVDRRIQGGWTYPDETLYCGLCGGAHLALKRQNISQDRRMRFETLSRKLISAKAAGMTHKTWVTVGGPNVRLSHMAANRQKVLINEKFRIAGEELYLPADPSASFAETAN